MFIRSGISLVGWLVIAGCATNAEPTKFKTDKMSPILEDVKTSKVTEVTVFSLPYRMTTFVAVTPETLVQMSKQPIHTNLTAAVRSHLIDALSQTTGRERGIQPDLRWGAHFLDPAGRCRHQIYLDAAGTGAIVDGTSAKVNRRLIGWFETYFQEAPGNQVERH